MKKPGDGGRLGASPVPYGGNRDGEGKPITIKRPNLSFEASMHEVVAAGIRRSPAMSGGLDRPDQMWGATWGIGVDPVVGF